MKFKELNYLLEDLFLAEDKTHLIKKTNLTPEQKQEVIQHFKQYPHKEKMINWNDLKNLTYKDFEKVISLVSKRKEEKDFKQLGLESLTKGKDYVVLYNSPSIQAIMPLNYKSSKFIASKYLGGCTGQWCTAYQKTKQYWFSYTKRGIKFAYFIDMKKEKTFKKIAMAYNDEQGYASYFDAADNSLDEEVVYKLLTKEVVETVKDAMKSIKNVDSGENSLTLDILRNRGVKHSIDRNGYVNVDGNCNINDLDLYDFGEIQFGTVTGDFNCSDNNLTSLKGSPIKVGANFFCTENKLRNLIDGPEDVGKSYFCFGNKLLSLKGSPKRVGEDFVVDLEYVNTLEWVPGIIEGSLLLCDSFQDSMFYEEEIRKAFNIKTGKIYW
jgi:hypothetical protein